MPDTTTFADIDARVIALNRTHNYVIDEKHQPYIARIEEVYLYDKSQHTHCCEFTPSYYLIHLYTRVIFTPAGDQLSDHDQDQIFQEYEHEDTDNLYVHCHEIDALEEKARPNDFTYYAHGDPEFGEAEDDFESEEAYHDAVIEALREHFQANCPI
jgi:hypothetical protein